MEKKRILIDKWEYEKVLRQIPFNIPIEPMYLFMYGQRISIRVIPRWTTWMHEQGKEEEIYDLDITFVRSSFENSMELHSIHVSSIPDIMKAAKGDIYETLCLIDDPSEANIRTKEQFDADFNNVLSNIQKST